MAYIKHNTKWLIELLSHNRTINIRDGLWHIHSQNKKWMENLWKK